MGRGRRRASTVAAALVVLVLAAAAACAGDDDDSADPPSATVGTAAPSTTSTTLSVEEEVEAAYLRSWEVYARAVRTFDTSELSDVYVGEALDSRLAEVERLRVANTPARMDVDHEITITIADDATAIVHDDYFNRSVLLDGATGEPIEDVPNETVRREYLMRRVDQQWKVAVVTAR